MYTTISATHKIITDDTQTQLVSDLTKLFGHVMSVHPGTTKSSLANAISFLRTDFTHFVNAHVKTVQQVLSNFNSHGKYINAFFFFLRNCNI